jgi:hypothetical protein
VPVELARVMAEAVYSCLRNAGHLRTNDLAYGSPLMMTSP